MITADQLNRRIYSSSAYPAALEIVGVNHAVVAVKDHKGRLSCTNPLT